jgi:glycosyltransferase involved in cell wall biosynthesis
MPVGDRFDSTRSLRQRDGTMKSVAGSRILMLLENNPYLQDSRVKQEAQTLHKAGYRVTVVCPKREASEPRRVEVEGVLIYQFRAAPNAGGFVGYVWEFGYSTLVMFLLSLIVWTREGVDVVHAHNPPETLFIIGAFYKIFGKKFVFDHHDVSPEMYDARYGTSARPFVRHILERLERLSFRVADQVISTNESHRKIATGRGRVPQSAVTVVRNGPQIADIGDIEPDPVLRAKAQTILGYVGIMGPQDGVDYLLRAMRHLVYDLGRQDVFCVLIGRGDSIPDLKDLADSLGIADKVWFTGWVSDREDLYRCLGAVDICVDPDPSNPYNDLCTMIKMMEYMVMSKPIVAFDLPEHRVSAGQAALYAAANDPMAMAVEIERLIDDPAQRNQMGKAGRERVYDELSWEHQEGNLISAYETVSHR